MSHIFTILIRNRAGWQCNQFKILQFIPEEQVKDHFFSQTLSKIWHHFCEFSSRRVGLDDICSVVKWLNPFTDNARKNSSRIRRMLLVTRKIVRPFSLMYFYEHERGACA